MDGGCSAHQIRILDRGELGDVLFCTRCGMFDGGGANVVSVWVLDTGHHVRDKAILELLLGDVVDAGVWCA